MRRLSWVWLGLGFGLLLAVGGTAWACLWDIDTLAAETKGVPEAVWVIVGRFERNPPLYYEMRLDRSTRRIESDPDDFEEYDDAGVACDRLGRSDEAIAWMEKKRARLDEVTSPVETVGQHRYRYLANVGTFWVHRWVRQGADRSKIDEVKTVRDFIAKAIALNPNAHFGRERYQLKAIDWIISPPPFDPKRDRELPAFLNFTSGGESPHDAVIGLTGLVALGNAWESVDVFNTLVRALDADGQRTSVAMLARWRAQELVDQGRESLLPGAPTGPALRELIARPIGGMLHEKQEADLKKLYQKLRAEADSWHEQRTAYMMERLKKGLHPDSPPFFWNEYADPSPPSLAEVPGLALVAPRNPSTSKSQTPILWLGLAGALLLALVVLIPIRRARKTQQGTIPRPKERVGQFLAPRRQPFEESGLSEGEFDAPVEEVREER